MMRLPASKVVPAERYAIVFGMSKIISLLSVKTTKGFTWCSSLGRLCRYGWISSPNCADLEWPWGTQERGQLAPKNQDLISARKANELTF
jgi:hypothetical protein